MNDEKVKEMVTNMENPSVPCKNELSIYRHYAKLLNCQSLILTGSVALSLYGLIKRGTSDIDLICVKPTDETLELLDRLKENMNNDSEYPTDNRISFRHSDGTKIDIFIYPKLTETPIYMVFDEVTYPVAMPVPIVQAKKSYGKIKHIIQLKAIAERFYKPIDLERYIEHHTKKY